MQSVFAKSLLGVCAAALLAGGAGLAQIVAPTTGGPAAEPSEQGAPAAAQPASEAEQPEDETVGDAPEGDAAGQAAESEADAASTQGEAETGGAEGEADAGSAEGDLSVETVVATVGDTTITLGQLIAARRTLPAEFQQLPDEVLMDALIEQLANQALLAQAAREAGLDGTPAVRLTLENQERAVLASAYMEQAMGERLTDAAIEAAYQERFANAEPVEEAHAAHILVEDEATAKEIKAKLDEGADFAALAAEHGTDGTASRGGDLGWFVHEQMVPPFADAVFAMEPGTVSDPVQTPFGWHVIKLIEKRPRSVPPLDSVREEIASELARTAQEEVVAEIRGSTEIQRDSDAVPASAIRADELLTE